MSMLLRTTARYPNHHWSLHALKDESYIRQTLQRQAAALHHVAVSYSVDTLLGIHPSKHSPTKKTLPDISKYGKGINTPGGGQEKDYISYTVSAPSGRGTALFSTDENQIMSENNKEDILILLVRIPPSTVQYASIGGRRSREKGRVIIVPHVPVT